MPLTNNADKSWDGWLIDGLGGQEAQVQSALVAAIEARNIPKSIIKIGTINMWWRKDSRYIDVISTLDGDMLCTIHLQEYGSSLWIGVAVEMIAWNVNYYKRMSASAFVKTIERCIQDVMISMVGEDAIFQVVDIAVGKK